MSHPEPSDARARPVVATAGPLGGFPRDPALTGVIDPTLDPGLDPVRAGRLAADPARWPGMLARHGTAVVFAVADTGALELLDRVGGRR